MTPIDITMVQKDDMLLSYYFSKKRSVRVVTYMRVVDDIYMKIYTGKSRKMTDAIFNWQEPPTPPHMKVFSVKPQDWVERKSDFSEVEFFKLDDEEVNMLMVEFI